jgi:hypothetical protein
MILMSEIRVSGWAELTDLLYAESWQEQLGRFRSDYAFRGVELPEPELLTGLMRLGGDYPDMEGHLLRNFRKYATRDSVAYDSPWNWLALGQHHGLPTRLLDWTFSPFVALHFATEHLSCFARDSVVWCVDFVRAQRDLPGPLRDALEEEGANVFTAEMLGRAAPALRDFDRLADGPFVAFFEPPSLDDRIVNQFALFSLMSSPTAELGSWLADRPGLWRRLIIPADLKWEVRDKLDQANVTERVLYPGLDGLTRWLRRQYTPAGRAALAEDCPGGEPAPRGRASAT